MPKVTEEHRQARRTQIVAAARTCVVEQGFHKTTMADVISASGLSAGAVYGYFKSKEEIVAAIALEALGTVESLFEQILVTEQPLKLADVFEQILKHVVAIAERPGGDVTRVALQAWAESLHNPTVMAMAQEKYTLIRGRFEALARRAQADGIIDADADPRYIAQVLFGLLPGFMLQRLLMGDTTPATYSAGLRAVLRD